MGWGGGGGGGRGVETAEVEKVIFDKISLGCFQTTRGLRKAGGGVLLVGSGIREKVKVNTGRTV